MLDVDRAIWHITSSHYTLFIITTHYHVITLIEHGYTLFEADYRTNAVEMCR